MKHLIFITLFTSVLAIASCSEVQKNPPKININNEKEIINENSQIPDLLPINNTNVDIEAEYPNSKEVFENDDNVLLETTVTSDSQLPSQIDENEKTLTISNALDLDTSLLFDFSPAYNADIFPLAYPNCPEGALNNNCIRIDSVEGFRSGIISANSLSALGKNSGITIKIRVHCPGQKIFFVGLKGKNDELIWSKNTDNSTEKFYNEPDKWTEFSGSIDFGKIVDLGDYDLYIINWVEDVSWFLDSVILETK